MSHSRSVNACPGGHAVKACRMWLSADQDSGSASICCTASSPSEPEAGSSRGCRRRVSWPALRTCRRAVNSLSGLVARSGDVLLPIARRPRGTPRRHARAYSMGTSDGVQKAGGPGVGGAPGAGSNRCRALGRPGWHGPSSVVSFAVAYCATISAGVRARIARVTVVGGPSPGGQSTPVWRGGRPSDPQKI